MKDSIVWKPGSCRCDNPRDTSKVSAKNAPGENSVVDHTPPREEEDASRGFEEP